MEDAPQPTGDTEEILRTGYRLEAESRALLARIDDVLRRSGRMVNQRSKAAADVDLREASTPDPIQH